MKLKGVSAGMFFSFFIGLLSVLCGTLCIFIACLIKGDCLFSEIFNLKLLLFGLLCCMFSIVFTTLFWWREIK